MRGKSPMTTAKIVHALKSLARAEGEKTDISMHCFLSGGAITRILRGEDPFSIVERAFWKRPNPAWGYIRIMEVESPGAVGNSLFEGVSVE